MAAMLQAEGLQANRLWQKERNSELGEFSHWFSCLFLSTHCLAPSWFKIKSFFLRRSFSSVLPVVWLLQFVA